MSCVAQIAVPRSGSVRGGSFTELDYETHTLIPCDHKHNTLRTLNGKVTVVSVSMTMWLLCQSVCQCDCCVK